MRIFTLIKEICLKIGLIADYVVEVGHSGDWTWQKYASGIVTLFGRHDYQNYAVKVDKVYGNYYMTSSPLTLTIPIKLVNYTNSAVSVQVTGAGADFSGKAHMGSENVVSWFWYNGSAYSVYGDPTPYVNIQISGYWK